MIAFNSSLLFIAFFLYFFSTIAFAVAITGKKWRETGSNEHHATHSERWNKYGFLLALSGFILHLAFIIVRWLISGHWPTSNMFEFTSFLAFAVVFAFLVIYRMYRIGILGVVVMPLAVILLAYASVFPTKITPLIPALKSYWLYIHVSVAALGEGAFAIGFAAGLLYLLHKVDQSKRSVETFLVEFTLAVVNIMIAFIILSFIFSGFGFTEEFAVIDEKGKEQIVKYTMPSFVSPTGGVKVTDNGFGPFFETPGWMKGVQAGKKLNTVIWSVLGGLLLYGIQRLFARKRLGQVAQNWFKDIDDEVVDEIGYRAIAIGFPIFTLGALVFAMIWAAEAWGRFWGWDPKETWALVTWFYYSIYLHLRLSVGWHGKRSAWMAVLGFIVVMFTLVGVNLMIAGLHSYA